MDQDFFSSIQKALKADERFSKNVADSVRIIFDSLHQRQHAFEEKKKSVQEEIDSGAKLTNHKISL
ncbi:MAG: hypothetical protein FWD62_05400 [Betaproteobacteria bacterium]|nr:hypothetical protein [Betaproteobacteria bacterium]